MHCFCLSDILIGGIVSPILIVAFLFVSGFIYGKMTKGTKSK